MIPLKKFAAISPLEEILHTQGEAQGELDLTVADDMTMTTLLTRIATLGVERRISDMKIKEVRQIASNGRSRLIWMQADIEGVTTHHPAQRALHRGVVNH